MDITKIRIEASGNINHPNPDGNPFLKFSQLKSSIAIEADLVEGDDLEECSKELRNVVDAMLKEHLAEQFNEAKNKHKKRGE